MSFQAMPFCLKCLDGEFSGFRNKRNLKLDALHSLTTQRIFLYDNKMPSWFKYL